jgi:hypothetical protein
MSVHEAWLAGIRVRIRQGIMAYGLLNTLRLLRTFITETFTFRQSSSARREKRYHFRSSQGTTYTITVVISYRIISYEMRPSSL